MRYQFVVIAFTLPISGVGKSGHRSLSDMSKNMMAVFWWCAVCRKGDMHPALYFNKQSLIKKFTFGSCICRCIIFK